MLTELRNGEPNKMTRTKVTYIPTCIRLREGFKGKLGVRTADIYDKVPNFLMRLIPGLYHPGSLEDVAGWMRYGVRRDDDAGWVAFPYSPFDNRAKDMGLYINAGIFKASSTNI